MATAFLTPLFFLLDFNLLERNLEIFSLKYEKMNTPITPPITEKSKVCKKLKSYLMADSGIANKNLTPLKEITANIFKKTVTILLLNKMSCNFVKKS